MGGDSDRRRLEAERANKEALARELEKSDDPSARREAERQSQEARGISHELSAREGNDPGRNRS